MKKINNEQFYTFTFQTPIEPVKTILAKNKKIKDFFKNLLATLTISWVFCSIIYLLIEIIKLIFLIIKYFIS